MSDDLTALPHDDDAERSVLKAAMESPIARKTAAKLIGPADFHQPAHEQLWRTIGDLERDRKPVDAATVSSAVAGRPHLRAALLEVVTAGGIPGQVDYFAEIVRGHAVRRRILTETTRARQAALDPTIDVATLTTATASRFAALRDSGATDDITARTLAEVIATEDEPYDWLVPDLLERGDRLMLTGVEGLGKSTLLRQIAVFTAAGMHPFGSRPVDPLKAVIIDAENTERHVKRKLRPLHQTCLRYAQRDPGPFVLVDCPGRLDITRDRDLARIHQMLDATDPDILVIGPLYRLVPRAIQTDDEAAPVLTALDTIRDRGIALLIEAHAGHGIGKHGDREMRPRGSSALLGWPEFGYGLREVDDATPPRVRMVAWRGDRDDRKWPTHLQMGDTWPWRPWSALNEGAA